MSEKSIRTEKEPKSILKARLLEAENEETTYRGRIMPKAEKEPQKPFTQFTRELIKELKSSNMEKEGANLSEHTLKLASLLKKWKWQRKKFWMRLLAFAFFLAYLLLLAVPVYLVWTGKYELFVDWGIGVKLFVTFACTVIAVSAIVSGWGSYKRWERRNAVK